MRFQSNSAFTKLAPDLVTDAYGGCNLITIIANTGTTVAMLPAAPAGSYYQLFAAALRASTTTSTTGNLSISDSTGNHVLAGFYETVGGQFVNWSGYVPWAGPLYLRNSMTVTGYCTLWYRTVNTPT